MDPKSGSFFIVHEIKTGKYDIAVEMKKHYIHHNHVQFWIWAYKSYHKGNTKPNGSFVKQVNLENLMPYIVKQTKSITGSFGWGI